MNDMNEMTYRMHELFGLLQDEESKRVFGARMRADVEHSTDAIAQLFSTYSMHTPESRAKDRRLLDEFTQVCEAKKRDPDAFRLVLYGTAMSGRRLAGEMKGKGIPFDCFCGRNAAKYPEGLLGKPVISPDELFRHPEDTYVIVAVIRGDSFAQIMNVLRKNGFPEERIIKRFDVTDNLFDEAQYFCFPSLIPEGRAFVDGGCYDGVTSRDFARICGGRYSKIFAFEPDPASYAVCEKNAADWGIERFELIQAGLSSEKGEAGFYALGNASSAMVDTAAPEATQSTAYLERLKTFEQKISLATIDDVAKDTPVGFIKLDVEGQELNALRGAAETIRRDKPFLAVCVYHRPGDAAALMDFLQTLVPEYRFWLRQHSSRFAETVLYASVRTE